MFKLCHPACLAVNKMKHLLYNIEIFEMGETFLKTEKKRHQISNIFYVCREIRRNQDLLKENKSRSFLYEIMYSINKYKPLIFFEHSP